MDMEENLILQNITDSSLKKLDVYDEYYDSFYDESNNNILENSEENDNDDEITTNTVYVYESNDYTQQLTDIYNSVNGVSALLLTLILFEIGKVVFNTLKEIF